MFVDKLFGIAENGHLPQRLRKVLREARIFCFPGRAHEVLPNSDVDNRVMESLDNEGFFLPFPVIAVEDTASVVVVWDDVPEQVGFGSKRYYLEASPLSINNLSEFDNVKGTLNADLRARLPKDSFQVAWGTICSIKAVEDGKRSWLADIVPEGLFMGTKEGSIEASGNRSLPAEVLKHFPNGSFIHFCDPDGAAEVAAHAGNNAVVALREVAYFNTPNRYVVETSPAKERRKPLREGQFPRSHERPVYELLTRAEIRHRMKLEEETGSHVTPHERKAHSRTYRHPRYVNVRGQTRRVRNTWVGGPTELVVGNRRYVVRLDL